MSYKLLFFVLLACIYCCSPVKYIKPLEKKQHAANVSLGGPLIGFAGTTIPIPFITAGYGYGIDSSLTGFASLNITSALYGNFQTELGLTRQLLTQRKYIPAVSITPVANIIYRSRNSYKLYPQLAINAFWQYGKRKNFFYFSFDSWLELSKNKAFGMKQQNHWIYMPSFGHNMSGKRWDLALETKIIAPNLPNEKLVVDYKTPLGNKGAFGIYIGYTYKFNKR